MTPDAAIFSPDTEYFFIGDGTLCVAIQGSRSDGMSPYGLLIVGNPEHLSRKEATLLFHPELGLRRTMITVVVDGGRWTADGGMVNVHWADDGVGVVVEWSNHGVSVTERFSIERIGDRSCLIRNVSVLSPDSTNISIEAALYANPLLFNGFGSTDGNTLYADGLFDLTLSSDPAGTAFERFLTVQASQATFLYSLPNTPPQHPESRTQNSEPRTQNSELSTQYSRSRNALRAIISRDGRFNAALWQYDFEWGLDAAMTANAAVCAGEFELSRCILSNILTRLSTDDGMIAEAGRFRSGDMSELNGNGAVLDAVWKYWCYTNDDEFIRSNWTRIAAIAEYPLRDEFAHESGLLKTRRDFWERTPWMGVAEGFELGHQTFCIVGLRRAAELAASIGSTDSATRWRTAADRILDAMLHHPTYSLIENGRFIRRRLTDGTVEQELHPGLAYHDERYAPYIGAVHGSPVACEPDSTEALPIVYGLVDARSDLARNTLTALGALWNPAEDGGYARYNTASDPDSAGAWPFATAFIASAELECGMTERAAASIAWLIRKAGTAGNWFEFYGAKRTPPYPPVGIIVWGWAQYILLYIEHILGIRIESDRLRIAPKIAGLSHTLRLSAYTVTITVSGEAGVPITDPKEISLQLPLTCDHNLEFIP